MAAEGKEEEVKDATLLKKDVQVGLRLSESAQAHNLEVNLPLSAKIIDVCKEYLNHALGNNKMYKYFHNGTEIKKDDTLLSLKTISPGDTLSACVGRGKPNVFWRFDPAEDVSRRCWCNSANYIDGITYVAQ